ncbi:uncharacterized protein LOC136024856 [Artemia franciscana]|uniref:uncharacterized protein LOC136024856 n=1 Tax=Artemia franciscana TaxID=6661 RepID=UPI0032DB6BD8
MFSGIQKRNGSSAAHLPFKPVTMNDLPVPEGSWEVLHRARQARYNKHLLGGLAFSLLTAVAAWQSGALYLGFKPTYKNK